jgi:hypothetical protein
MSNYGLIYPRLIGEGGPWNGWCYAEFTWSNPIREYAWEFKYVNEGDESVTITSDADNAYPNGDSLWAYYLDSSLYPENFNPPSKCPAKVASVGV